MTGGSGEGRESPESCPTCGALPCDWAAGSVGWQPIASAPDDEFEAIILWNGYEVVPGCAWEGGWINCWHDWMDPQPTHWMSLPEAPAA